MNRNLALILVVSAFATSACWLSSDAELAEMTLQRLSGRVSIERDGEQIDVADEMALRSGDVVTTDTGNSRARLRLAGSFRLELAPSSGLEVLGQSAVNGRSGELLGSTSERVTVSFGQARAVTSDAVFRLDLGAGSARAGVYSGSLTLRTPGQGDTRLDAYFQSTVAAYSRVLRPVPLSISEADRWDRVHLADVLELDERLERLGTGLATQIGRRRPGLDYFRTIAVRRDISFMKRYLDRAAPDLLIGFTVARGSKDPLQAAWADAFSLFDQGAIWGLVARILEVEPDPLVADLRRLVASTGVLAGGLSFGVAGRGTSGGSGRGPGGTAPGDGSGSGGGGGDTGTGGGGGDGGGGGGGGGDGGGDPGPGEEPPGLPIPPPDDDCDPLQNPTCLLPLPRPTGGLGDLIPGRP